MAKKLERRYKRFPIKVKVGITSDRVGDHDNITDYNWSFVGTKGERPALRRTRGFMSFSMKQQSHADKHSNKPLRDFVLIRRAPADTEKSKGKILFVVTNVSSKHQTKVIRRFLKIALRQFDSVEYDGNYISFSSLSDQTLFNLKYV